MISAFKHIRLSGYNLTPSTDIHDSTKLRLGFGNSGLAYYSELTGVSGYLHGLITGANSDVQSINVDGTTLQNAITFSGRDGLTIGTENQVILFSGNSGYFQGEVTRLDTYNTNYSGWANAEFVKKATQQVFKTSLSPNSEEYTITYPVAFSSVPKVQATLEVSGDVMYSLSIKNIGTNGYTGALSDILLEDHAYIHTFASNQ